MNPLYIVLIVVAVLVVLFFVTAGICFKIAFFVTKKQKKYEEFKLPRGEIYLQYKDKMVAWMKEAKEIPHEELSITSFDRLTLLKEFEKYYSII